MLPGGEQFHQPVAAVPLVQGEGEPHDYRCGHHPAPDAEPLFDACHIEDDKHHEHGQQSAGEDEKVLRPKPLELYVTAHAFVDFKFCHRVFVLLQEEGAQDRGRDNQEDAGAEP